MSSFSIVARGQIESAVFPEVDDIFCKFSFAQGPDWSIVNGNEEGITQQSLKGAYVYDLNSQPKNVWNFPLDITFKSTNPFGWPQIVLAVYGPDLFGRDIIRGYGSTFLPRTPGMHILYIPTFVPLASSHFNSFLSKLAGRAPEFLDPTFVAKADGREVTRVQSNGVVKIQLNIIVKDLKKLGYRYE